MQMIFKIPQTSSKRIFISNEQMLHLHKVKGQMWNEWLESGREAKGIVIIFTAALQECTGYLRRPLLEHGGHATSDSSHAPTHGTHRTSSHHIRTSANRKTPCSSNLIHCITHLPTNTKETEIIYYTV